MKSLEYMLKIFKIEKLIAFEKLKVKDTPMQ